VITSENTIREVSKVDVAIPVRNDCILDCWIEIGEGNRSVPSSNGVTVDS
jgi:hypothetical protein